MSPASTNFRALLAHAAEIPSLIPPISPRIQIKDGHEREDVIRSLQMDAKTSQGSDETKVQDSDETKVTLARTRPQSKKKKYDETGKSVHGDAQDSKKAAVINAQPIVHPPRGVTNSLSTSWNPKKFDAICLDLVSSLSVPRSTKRSSMSTIGSQESLTSCQLGLPVLFRSLCICEFNKMRGHPIQLKSKYFTIGPRGLKVGACEFVNLAYDNESGAFCDLTSRPDINGRPRFILEYADTLVSVESGMPTWVVATQMNVTEIIQKLALLSQTPTEGGWLQRSEHQAAPEDSSSDNSSTQDLDFDSAVVIDDDSETSSETHSVSIHFNLPFVFYDHKGRSLSSEIDESIDWVEAACITSTNDEDPVDRDKNTKVGGKNIAEVNPQTAGAFSDLVHDVCFLHRSCFVLAASADIVKVKPSTPPNYWQIAFMSPYLYSRPLDRQAALKHTPAQSLQKLGIMLSSNRPVSFLVNWGQEGISQRLYCSPMLRGDSVGCWVCFLIDPKLGDLW